MEISKTAINGSLVSMNANVLAGGPSKRKHGGPHGHSVGTEMSGGAVPHSFALSADSNLYGFPYFTSPLTFLFR
jgi:hypothetical protein